MSQRLTNKIALITGGSSGIGLATAKLFAKEGATVIISGRRQKELDQAAREIGHNSVAIPCDVTKVTELGNLFAEIKQKYGHLDIVFANAGALRINTVEDTTEEEYSQVFDTSVKGSIFTVQKALPLLSNGASIILNSAAIANQGIQGLALNSAAKAAVRSLARTLTMELKDRNIRVNVVSPGSVVTPILDAAGITMDTANKITDGGAKIPMGRPGTADEIAQAVLFLASDDSSYITGIDLAVDGGQAQV